MREILFRGMTIDGDWTCGYYVFTPKRTGMFGQTISDADFDRHYILTMKYNLVKEVIPETVGQYTGLTDKNGKKIFEGDVLKGKHDWRNWNTSFGNDEQDFLEQKIRGAYGKYIDKTVSDIFGQRYHYFRNYAVEYYAPIGGWRVRNGSCFHDLTKNHILNRELEVIGNIHDNPELLKGGGEGCKLDNMKHTAES